MIHHMILFCSGTYNALSDNWLPILACLVKPNDFGLNAKMVHEGELKDLIADGRVITSIIPDIESVNYGRGVGYEIIEHIPPNEIGEISATSIREKMRKDGKL